MLRSTCCILEIWGSLGKHVPVELHTLKTLKQTTSLKCNDSIGVWGCPQLSWLSSHCLLVRLHFQGVLFVGEELLPLLSTVQCGSLFVWTFDVCFLVLYTVLSPPPKWISLCSAWICECLLPIQNLTFFSVSASDPKHLHSWSNPPDSVVPLNSLFAAAVVLGTWPQENWTGVQLWACKHHPWGEHWTAHLSVSNSNTDWSCIEPTRYTFTVVVTGIILGLWSLPHPCLFFTAEWIVFVQPGTLIYFLGISHLWLFLGWSESPVLYISGWVIWGIPTNVVMMYVMYIGENVFCSFFS